MSKHRLSALSQQQHGKKLRSPMAKGKGQKSHLYNSQDFDLGGKITSISINLIQILTLAIYNWIILVIYSRNKVFYCFSKRNFFF